MYRAVPVLFVLLNALGAARAQAVVLPDAMRVQAPAQLQIVRLSLAAALAPMQCRTVAMRVHVGRYQVTADRAAGAVAALVIRKPSKDVEPEQVCQQVSGY